MIIKRGFCKSILILNLPIFVFLSQSVVAGGPPPPADYENWDASEHIKITMILCGEKNVEERIIEGALSLNSAAIVQNCMLKKGLILKKTDGRVAPTICDQNPSLPACLTVR